MGLKLLSPPPLGEVFIVSLESVCMSSVCMYVFVVAPKILIGSESSTSEIDGKFPPDDD